MGELEDRVGDLKARVRRLESAMAEIERVSRRVPDASGALQEAIRDFDRDLVFVERTFARVKAAADAPPAAGH